MARHKWFVTDLGHEDGNVERCQHCDTERTRDTSTRSLYLYRRGRAIQPSRKPMPETWAAYIAGVTPKCVDATKEGG